MTPEEFLTNYPEFKQKQVSAIAYTLTLSTVGCPTQIWGTLQSTAIGLLAAHCLAAYYGQMAVIAGTAGTVAAGNQVSFPTIPSNPTENDAFLGLTVYGLQLKMLKGQLAELAKAGQLGNEAKNYHLSLLANTGFAF
jgi:hypothetical protein